MFGVIDVFTDDQVKFIYLNVYFIESFSYFNKKKLFILFLLKTYLFTSTEFLH